MTMQESQECFEKESVFGINTMSCGDDKIIFTKNRNISETQRPLVESIISIEFSSLQAKIAFFSKLCFHEELSKRNYSKK